MMVCARSDGVACVQCMGRVCMVYGMCVCCVCVCVVCVRTAQRAAAAAQATRMSLVAGCQTGGPRCDSSPIEIGDPLITPMPRPCQS